MSTNFSLYDILDILDMDIGYHCQHISFFGFFGKIEMTKKLDTPYILSGYTCKIKS